MKLVKNKNITKFLELLDVRLRGSLVHDRKYVFTFQNNRYCLTNYLYSEPETVNPELNENLKRIILPPIKSLLDFDDVELGVVPMSDEILCFQWNEPTQKFIIVPLGEIV